MNRKSAVLLHLLPCAGQILEKQAVAIHFLPLPVELGSWVILGICPLWNTEQTCCVNISRTQCS